MPAARTIVKLNRYNEDYAKWSIMRKADLKMLVDRKRPLFMRGRGKAVVSGFLLRHVHGPDGVDDGQDHDAHVGKDGKPHAGQAQCSEDQAYGLHS